MKRILERITGDNDMDWINVTFNYTKNDEVVSLSRVFDSVNVDEVEIYHYPITVNKYTIR